MIMIFAAAFGWVTLLSVLAPLKKGEVPAEVSELFKPHLVAAGVNWVLARLPHPAVAAAPVERLTLR
jgi:hypothetical protein